MNAIGWLTVVVGAVLLRVGPFIALLYGVWIAVDSHSFGKGLVAFLLWSVACVMIGLVCVLSSVFMTDD
jgi:hypothetical protein